jgi:hypothetical protein
MLYLVGLGLADEKDITVKGLEIVKKAERVYLEAYTAILLVEKEQLVYSFHIPPPYKLNHAFEILIHLLCDSRKPSMAAPLSSPTAKWSNRLATIF